MLGVPPASQLAPTIVARNPVCGNGYEQFQAVNLFPPLRVCAPGKAKGRCAAPSAEERTKAAEGERNFTAQPRRRRLRINRED